MRIFIIWFNNNIQIYLYCLYNLFLPTLFFLIKLRLGYCSLLRCHKMIHLSLIRLFFYYPYYGNLEKKRSTLPAICELRTNSDKKQNLFIYSSYKYLNDLLWPSFRMNFNTMWLRPNRFLIIFMICLVLYVVYIIMRQNSKFNKNIEQWLFKRIIFFSSNL